MLGLIYVNGISTINLEFWSNIRDILFLATTLTLFQSRGGRLSIPTALVATKVSAFSPPDLKMFPLPWFKFSTIKEQWLDLLVSKQFQNKILVFCQSFPIYIVNYFLSPKQAVV